MGMSTPGFCIFIHTFCEGEVPSCYDGDHRPVVFPTRLEAEREIVDFAMTRMQEFLDGERDFDDAITIEEYIVEVQVWPDGSMTDEDGNHFAGF
jgi:hypothetical protein